MFTFCVFFRPHLSKPQWCPAHLGRSFQRFKLWSWASPVLRQPLVLRSATFEKSKAVNKKVSKKNAFTLFLQISKLKVSKKLCSFVWFFERCFWTCLPGTKNQAVSFVANPTNEMKKNPHLDSGNSPRIPDSADWLHFVDPHEFWCFFFLPIS